MTRGCLVIPAGAQAGAGAVFPAPNHGVSIEVVSRPFLSSTQLSQEAGISVFVAARDLGAWACALDIHCVWAVKTSDHRRQRGEWGNQAAISGGFETGPR